MAPFAWRMLTALALIGLNGFFVMTEFAFVRVRPSRLEVLARRGSQSAVLAQGILQHLEVYLSALQLGITMASLGLGWVGEPTVAALVEPYLARIPYGGAAAHGLSFVLAFASVTSLQILAGELVPRSVGLQKAEAIALRVALPLRLYYLAFKVPVTWLAAAASASARLLGFPAHAGAEPHLTEEEIRVLLGSTEAKPGLSLERLMLMENIFDFGTAKVADAMVPAERVAYLSLRKDWKDNLEIIRSRRHSRYPLCSDGLDSASGYVHVKDIALAPPSGAAPDLAALRRGAAEVGPEDPLQKLLQAFADKGIHFALVKEAGRVAGIITLEDILEEIVGEIQDEFDVPQAWSFTDLLVPSAVHVDSGLADARALTRRLIADLHAAHPAFDREGAVRAVWERENAFSSAMGRGIAIPHARLPALDKPLVAMEISSKPLPFRAPDRLPVRLVFLVLTPAGTPIAQLKVLARIASFASNDNLRRRLLRAKTRESAVGILRTADTVLAA